MGILGADYTSFIMTALVFLGIQLLRSRVSIVVSKTTLVIVFLCMVYIIILLLYNYINCESEIESFVVKYIAQTIISAMILMSIKNIIYTKMFGRLSHVFPMMSYSSIRSESKLQLMYINNQDTIACPRHI